MSTINSDGVKITEKTTVASVSGTDKVIINQGDAVKQATVDTLVNGSSLNTKVGLLESLTTGVKTSIVNAINWVVTQLNTVNEKIGTTDISAIGNGTVTGAISTVNQSLTNCAKSFLITADISNTIYVRFTKPTWTRTPIKLFVANDSGAHAISVITVKNTKDTDAPTFVATNLGTVTPSVSVSTTETMETVSISGLGNYLSGEVVVCRNASNLSVSGS